MSKGAQKLQIIPLGGLGEIGKNMTVIRVDDEILVIDSGLMFPEEDMLGIDLVIPDVTYLKENIEKVKAFAKMLDTKVKSSVNENGMEPIEIEFQDERLTTVEAKQILSERGVKISEQKKVLDQVAAEIILGDYRQKLKARKE